MSDIESVEKGANSQAKDGWTRTVSVSKEDPVTSDAVLSAPWSIAQRCENRKKLTRWIAQPASDEGQPGNATACQFTKRTQP